LRNEKGNFRAKNQEIDKEILEMKRDFRTISQVMSWGGLRSRKAALKY